MNEKLGLLTIAAETLAMFPILYKGVLESIKYKNNSEKNKDVLKDVFYIFWYR